MPENLYPLRAKSLRLARGLTQAEVADKLGIVVRTYSSYESPDADPPGSIVAATAKLYGVSTDWILGLREFPNDLEPHTWLVDLDVVDALRSSAPLPPGFEHEAVAVPIPRRGKILSSREYAALAAEIEPLRSRRSRRRQ